MGYTARMTALLAAIAIGGTAAEGVAGFILIATRFQATTEIDRIEIRIVNFDRGGQYQPFGGVNTGKFLYSYDFFFDVYNYPVAGRGDRAYFQVNAAGGPGGGDIVDLANRREVPLKTTLRIGPLSNLFAIGADPSAMETEPGQNPYAPGLSNFRALVLAREPIDASPISPTAPVSTALLIADLYVDKDAGLKIWGRIDAAPGIPMTTISQFSPYTVFPEDVVPEPTGVLLLCAGSLTLLLRRSRTAG